MYHRQISMSECADRSTMSGFDSIGWKTQTLREFPAFTGTRVMMMPFYVQDIEHSLPKSLHHYKSFLKKMIENVPSHVEYYNGNTAYLTIDEMHLVPNKIQRKAGLHVDGMYNGQLAGAWGGGGGGWGSVGNGMLLVSNTDDLCKMWTGKFEGMPINDGDCEHLRDQLPKMNEYTFKRGDVIWADGLMVHESYPATEQVYRQFIRISMPNNAPWFKGYSENPLGILPSGVIIDQPRI